MGENLVYVQVLYDFEYDADDGKRICMKEGEEFLLLNKTNTDWWQVIRDGERRPFYAPASYMEENCKQETVNLNLNLINENGKVDEHDLNVLNVVDNVFKEDIPIEVSNGEKTYQGLLFSNPLYNVKTFSEPEVDYSDEEDDSDENGQGDLCLKQNGVGSVAVKRFVLGEIKVAKEDESVQQNSSFENPVYMNLPLHSPPTPPSPTEKDPPTRILLNNWAEYECSNGRKFYFNSVTCEKSWKPPRRRSEKMSSCSSGDSSPWPDRSDSSSISPTFPSNTSLTLPTGWLQSYDEDIAEICFINDLTKEKWYSSTDSQGRIYYYKENASESFWQLPEVVLAENENGKKNELSLSTASSPSDVVFSPGDSPITSPQPRRMTSHSRPSSVADRRMKTRSMVLPDSKSSTLPRNYSGQQFGGFLKAIRQGMMNKTKVIEGGKKLRKNWSQSFIILSDIFLLFYKDMKCAQMKQDAPGCKPEICIDLAGALVEWKPDKSSRKNVFQISTVLGLQVLLQDDCGQTSREWFEAIRSAIMKLPSGYSINSTASMNNSHEGDLSSPDETKKSYKLTRKFKTSVSAEELDFSSADRKTKIKDKLLNFFLRRPTMESLREKGIIKEEPVFGCNLQNLCLREKSLVPRFVQKCISLIEENDMKADGLYRASGNLSQVQKIRFQVNQDNMRCLELEEDVHVLTGALKMFFRELKEPLIPFKVLEKFLSAIMIPDRAIKLQRFTELISLTPRAHYNTLKYLLQHLLRVTEYSDHNRMHIQNMAIVFGPTLMWAEVESSNLALDVMTQNQIIEFLLLEFQTIFSFIKSGNEMTS
uniref:Rho GTPase-activating protein 15 n=1 Tax=Strigamia maritima TaxID=126957 RepID=T1JJK9_STRMM